MSNAAMTTARFDPTDLGVSVAEAHYPPVAVGDDILGSIDASISCRLLIESNT